MTWKELLGSFFTAKFSCSFPFVVDLSAERVEFLKVLMQPTHPREKHF